MIIVFINIWNLYYLLFSVTEDHPEVKTLVLRAMEESKQMSQPPFEMYADVLQKHIKQVSFRFNINSDFTSFFSYLSFLFSLHMSNKGTLLFEILKMYDGNLKSYNPNKHYI